MKLKSVLLTRQKSKKSKPEAKLNNGKSSGKSHQGKKRVLLNNTKNKKGKYICG